MSEAATRKDIDDVIGIVREFMDQVAERFDSVDEQFATVNNRLDKMEQNYSRLLNTIDGFIGRIDKYEIELAARDSQFERLLTWARKVSETGIPLENL